MMWWFSEQMQLLLCAVHCRLGKLTGNSIFKAFSILEWKHNEKPNAKTCYETHWRVSWAKVICSHIEIYKKLESKEHCFQMI